MKQFDKTEKKIKIYKATVEIREVEVWETTKHMRKRLWALKMGYWRKGFRFTLQDKVSSTEEVRERMNICASINNAIDAKRLRCYGQVSRTGNDSWQNKLLQWPPPERRKRRRPRKACTQGVRNAVIQSNLKDDWKYRKTIVKSYWAKNPKHILLHVYNICHK